MLFPALLWLYLTQAKIIIEKYEYKKVGDLVYFGFLLYSGRVGSSELLHRIKLVKMNACLNADYRNTQIESFIIVYIISRSASFNN